MLRRYLSLVIKDVGALVSGVLGLPSAYAAFYFCGVIVKTIFATVTVCCFAYSGYRIWRIDHPSIRELRRRWVQDRLKELNAAEREALRQLIIRGGMFDNALQKHLMDNGYAVGSNFIGELSAKTNFLEKSYEGQFTVKQYFLPLLE